METPLSSAYQLWVEHFSQLSALVRRRLEVAWRYRPKEEMGPLEPELLDYVNEFGRLLQVVFHYGLLDALKEEAAWYVSMLTSRGPGKEAFALLLDSWIVAIQGIIKPPECHTLAQPLENLRAGLDELFALAHSHHFSLPEPEVTQLVEVLIEGDAARAMGLVSAWLAQGGPPYGLIPARLLPALGEIGRRWELNRLAVYQEHLATETLIRLLCGLPAQAPPPLPLGRTALVTCVPGEEHQVVPLALAVYLELRGWRVRSLGRSLPLAQIAAAAAAFAPEVVFLSLTMLSRLEEALATVARLKSLNPHQAVVMGGRGTRASRHLLNQAGVQVAEDFEAAHRLALEATGHA
jgi:methanogenic corrinoid protein MtbC1